MLFVFHHCQCEKPRSTESGQIFQPNYSEKTYLNTIYGIQLLSSSPGLSGAYCQLEAISAVSREGQFLYITL